jgi:flagellar motor switch protein FliG
MDAGTPKFNHYEMIMTPLFPVAARLLPRARLAAMLLLELEIQSSAKVIRQFKPDEIRRISEEIAALVSVPSKVSQDFESVRTNGSFSRSGSVEVRHLIELGLAAESAEKKFDSLSTVENTAR